MKRITKVSKLRVGQYYFFTSPEDEEHIGVTFFEERNSDNEGLNLWRTMTVVGGKVDNNDYCDDEEDQDWLRTMVVYQIPKKKAQALISIWTKA